MFADLRDIKSTDEYMKYLDGFIQNRFTDDYFNGTLPKDLTYRLGQFGEISMAEL